MRNIALLIVLCTVIQGCSSQNSKNDYPEEWGKRLIDTSSKCGNISGTYVIYMPDGDSFATSLLGCLLCGKKEKVDTSIQSTDIRIDYISPERIEITLLEKGEVKGVYQLNEGEFYCSGGMVKINCVPRDDPYFSGYQNSKISFVKNSEGALVIHSESIGIGLALKAIPLKASQSLYYRFLPSSKARAGHNKDHISVAIPIDK